MMSPSDTSLVEEEGADVDGADRDGAKQEGGVANLDYVGHLWGVGCLFNLRIHLVSYFGHSKNSLFSSSLR